MASVSILLPISLSLSRFHVSCTKQFSSRTKAKRKKYYIKIRADRFLDYNKNPNICDPRTRSAWFGLFFPTVRNGESETAVSFIPECNRCDVFITDNGVDVSNVRYDFSSLIQSSRIFKSLCLLLIVCAVEVLVENLCAIWKWLVGLHHRRLRRQHDCESVDVCECMRC